MTIHPGDPFAPPPHERDAARRFRARIGGGVTLWTAGHGDGPRDRSGLTVSSLMTALGEPPHVLALLDPDAELTDALVAGGTAVVNLLSWRDRHLAEVFAGLAPAPGGRFVPDTWRDSSWGPVLAAARAWAGVRLVGQPTPVGWSLLVDTMVEHVAFGTAELALLHVRGRYAAGPEPRA